MFCPKCGNEIVDASQPCPSCGNIAEQQAAPSEPIAAQAAETVKMPAVEDVAPAAPAAASVAQEAADKAAASAAEAPRAEQAAAKKSKAPMIIAAVVALVVGAAVSALVTWQIAAGSGQGEVQQAKAELEQAQADLQQAKAELEKKGGELETAKAELDAAKAELDKLKKGGSSSSDGQDASKQGGTTFPDAAEADSSSSTGLNAYLGTWQGDMTKTKALGLNADNCYGAEGRPFVLTITEVNATGSIKGTAKVLYHNHAKVETGDIASSDGDEYLEIDGLVGTLSSNGEFTFEKELPGHSAGQEIVIDVKTVDNTDGTRALEAEVTTKASLGGDVEDSYTLTKE